MAAYYSILSIYFGANHLQIFLILNNTNTLFVFDEYKSLTIIHSVLGESI